MKNHDTAAALLGDSVGTMAAGAQTQGGTPWML